MSWYKKGATYRAKSLDALKTLYSCGVHATLESQPATPWEDNCQTLVKPGNEPKGIQKRQGCDMSDDKFVNTRQTGESQ